jgi:hypothetical protein
MLRFIYVQVIFFADFREGLNTYGKLLQLSHGDVLRRYEC